MVMRFPSWFPNASLAHAVGEMYNACAGEAPPRILLLQAFRAGRMRGVCVSVCVCPCACLRLFVYVSVWGAVRDHHGRLRALVKRVNILVARGLGLGDQGKTGAVS